jgi:hypothetical protein
MKSFRVILVSIAGAALALTAVHAPASFTVSVSAAGALASPLPPPVMICTARSLTNIRSGPSTRTRIVARMPRNGVFFSVERRGSWLRGNTAWGAGWVSASLMRCKK